MNSSKTVQYKGLNIPNLKSQELAPFLLANTKKKSLVGYLNGYGILLQNKNSEFSKALQMQDYTLCDGVGASLTTWGATGQWVKKQPIPSWIHSYLQILNQHKKSLLIWGHSKEQLQKISKVLKEKFPDIIQLAHFDGYHSQLDKVVDYIQEKKPDHVLMAMGMPKQEILASNKKLLNLPSHYFLVGATLLYYCKIEEESPQWVRRLNLEWLWRWIHEPLRLAPRYLIGNSLVVVLTLAYFLRRLCK